MEEIKLLMVGLESSGKTTILYKLKTGEVTTTIPTVGHNVESVKYKNINLITWDMGGQPRVRTTWNIHSKNTRALIFVVDSNDRDNIDEARGELHKMLNDESLKEVPLLVYANKQDLDEKMSLHEITEKLNLATLKGRCWYIQATDAIGGEGLYEGLNWLTLALTN